jgi:MoaA/NifB/PqqE/SkfB family radical SAM enzyme
MKAAINSRVILKAHIPLETVIPLLTPFVLIVDPASSCNLRCRYCPTGDTKLIRATKRHSGTMSFKIFKKLIDDLMDFPDPVKTLRLYKEGEPLLNSNFAHMVSYAKNSHRVIRIDTTTNGLLLNPKLNLQIIEAGLDRINISVNGINEDQYLHFTKSRVNFDQFVGNVRHLFENRGDCEVYIKGIKECLSPDDQSKFFDIFGNISDLIFLENLSPAWPDFTFNGVEMKFETGNYGQEIHEREVCPNIFYTMVVNSDGSVSLCVGDWPHKLLVGSVINNSLKEIWLGSEINAHRISHLDKKRKDNQFCAVCQVMSHGTLENIDHAADHLLKVLKNQVIKD